MQSEEKRKHINQADKAVISIITPLYNAASFISQTIQSVQNQGYQHWEHLIVDDMSTDNSVAIAEKFASTDSRIQIIKNNKNQGPAACRNMATLVAKGAYIAFLDADDLWHATKLEKQLAFMRDKQIDVSYTSYTHIDIAGNSLKKRINALPRLTYAKQLRNNYIGNLTGMYRVSEIGKVASPALPKRQDWAVWLEAIKRSDKAAFGIREDLAMYRVHGASMSSNKRSLVKHNFNFYRKHLGYSWGSSVYYLIQFFWEYFINRPKLIERF